VLGNTTASVLGELLIVRYWLAMVALSSDRVQILTTLFCYDALQANGVHQTPEFARSVAPLPTARIMV
jgi:hypothetical protein